MSTAIRVKALLTCIYLLIAASFAADNYNAFSFFLFACLLPALYWGIQWAATGSLKQSSKWLDRATLALITLPVIIILVMFVLPDKKKVNPFDKYDESPSQFTLEEIRAEKARRENLGSPITPEIARAELERRERLRAMYQELKKRGLEHEARETLKSKGQLEDAIRFGLVPAEDSQ